MIEHTKDALWLLNKVLADKSRTIESVFAINKNASQAKLLQNLSDSLFSRAIPKTTRNSEVFGSLYINLCSPPVLVGPSRVWDLRKI